MTTVLIYLKYPQEGKVKTRLAKDIGQQEATRVYEKLLHYTFAVTDQLPKAEFKVVAMCDPFKPLSDYQAYLSSYRAVCRHQSGRNLGERLANGFRETLNETDSAIAVGTDCPGLETQHYHQSRSLLKTQYDLVLGPSRDGGYYLLGMKHFYPTLFTEIPWSTEMVGRLTQAKAKGLGLNVHRLELLSDIDTLEDWEKAKSDFATGKRWD